MLPNCDISDLQNDSRKIKTGSLFFAYPGMDTDGRLFINQAANAGAVAVLYEPADWPIGCKLPEGVINIAIPNLIQCSVEIAQRFYGQTQDLTVIGVTGTNGKTTIAYQLAQAYALLGTKAAYVGTLGQGNIAGALSPLANTTPDALCLQQLFADYRGQGIHQVCLEVSSHALCQNRVQGIDFNQAIFTNLSHEHLDYHPSMEAYAHAKAQLFATPNLRYAIINIDDAYSSLMQPKPGSSFQLFRYGITHAAADVQAIDYRNELSGLKIVVNSPWGQHQLRIPVLGFFNIYNALAIFSSLLLSGYPAEQVIHTLSQLKSPPGRMEIVAKEPAIIVDYAHSPDALENVLATLTPLVKGKIIVVFGCGGDRDKFKRPMMGKIAARYAEVVILTNDNPRSENPLAIIDAIAEGINSHTSNNVYKILDREQAITKAIALANQDDLILVAGKGHETYQLINGISFLFSDQDVIRQALDRL